jgi:hypothetical protein
MDEMDKIRNSDFDGTHYQETETFWDKLKHNLKDPMRLILTSGGFLIHNMECYG